MLSADRAPIAADVFAFDAASLREILAWDLERVVVSHGDVVERDAKAKLAGALRWMTEGTPRLLTA